MKERNSLSPTESMDTSMISAPQGAIEEREPAPLPRGSALLLDTILMLARQIQESEELEEAKAKACKIAEQASELIEKYDRQFQFAA